ARDRGDVVERHALGRGRVLRVVNGFRQVPKRFLALGKNANDLPERRFRIEVYAGAERVFYRVLDFAFYVGQSLGAKAGRQYAVTHATTSLSSKISFSVTLT